MVRGELFKRYPNAIVYAAKATRNAQGQLALDPTDERYPLFRGALSPDMTFFASTPRPPTHGEERPGGSRTAFSSSFKNNRRNHVLAGADVAAPVAEWSDLMWTTPCGRDNGRGESPAGQSISDESFGEQSVAGRLANVFLGGNQCLAAELPFTQCGPCGCRDHGRHERFQQQLGREQRPDRIHFAPLTVPGSDSREPDVTSSMSTAHIPAVTVASSSATTGITAATPVLLLPVHIQTRFAAGQDGSPQLWVRIYPDQIAVNSHEPQLTVQEIADGQAY